MLEQWGLDVTQASDGASAVEAVERRGRRRPAFDLVLMDVHMPVMSGHAAVRALRERFDAETLPVIALTAAALTSERDEGDGRGHERLPHQADRRRAAARDAGALSAPNGRRPKLRTASDVQQRQHASTAKIAAAMPCTRRIGTFFATTSPAARPGTLAIIMPSVVPATFTATRSA